MDYQTLASDEGIRKTVAALQAKGYNAMVMDTKEQALAKIKELIPAGASVMNGASVTLERIGYVDYLTTGNHQWLDLHAKVNAESDKAKRDRLRRESVLSDWYLGSVHALAQTGEFLVASNTGSQLSHVVYTSPQLLLVASTKKIVPTLADAFERLNKHVIPSEDKHMKEKYGMGTARNKLVVFFGESPMTGRKIHFLLIKEDLGF